MGKQKKAVAPYLIDLHQIRIRTWPLFGLDRLVKVQRRQRNGVLYCDHGLSTFESITFSPANVQTSLITMISRSVES